MTNAAAVGVGAPSRERTLTGRIGLASRRGKSVEFLLISTQLGLLLILLWQFEIEPESGLPRILPLVFAGFLVHAALPLSWRQPFFLLLSAATFGLVLGPVPATALMLIGVSLVGACHLRIAFWARVLVIALIGSALALWLTGLFGLTPIQAQSKLPIELPRVVLPVLGSMFMFRLVIYLYDLRHEEHARASGLPTAARTLAPATIWTRLSYFFLLPNVCFLLFPVVDYRTFRRTYYDSEENAIYQTGVWWICLGLVYLLAYRLVYHYLVPSPDDVSGLGGIVRFMTASYLIYLRVVGQFHLIVGLLCLFGFNLPPAHRYFLLASGFTDFWRRARIEWKDFMVKVFYYPTLVPLQRRFGVTPSLVIATVVVFIATWLLHSYQWFWLRGDFRLSTADGVFWTIIGGCVLVNSLIEARRPRAKPAATFSLGHAVTHASKVVGMFVFMSVLWSYWSSPSTAIWLSYLTAAAESGPASWVMLAAGVAGLIAAGVAAQYVALRFAVGPARARPAARKAAMWRPAFVLVVAVLLLLARLPATASSVASPVASIVATLSTDRLNAMDLERHDRSYYEVLLDGQRSTAAWLAAPGIPGAPPPDEEILEDAGAGEQPSTGAVAPPADSANREDPSEADSGGSGRDDDLLEIEWAAPRPQPVWQVRLASTAGDLPYPRSGYGSSFQESGPQAPPTTISPQARQGKPFWRRTRRYERPTNDIRLWENIPGSRARFKGAPVIINEWGMRDKPYSKTPPPRTYRMALLGTSMTVGAGVPVEQTMESLLEDRLNREGPGAPGRRYEILNFSVGGYGIMQCVATLDQKVLDFLPSALLVGVFSIETQRMRLYLSNLVRSQVPIPYPYVREKIRQAGVDHTMLEPELRRRLSPVAQDLVRWSYQHIAEVSRKRGIPAVALVLPEPRAGRDDDIDQTARLAAAAGLPLIDLRGIYQGRPIGSLSLDAEGDPHWNVAGHQLVADRIFELMRETDARGLKLGFRR